MTPDEVGMWIIVAILAAFALAVWGGLTAVAWAIWREIVETTRKKA